MSITKKLREGLGLGEKPEPNVTHLPEDFYDQPVEQKAAAPTEEEEPVEKTELEEIEAAAERLETLELGEGSWSLIDRAMDSLSRNTGAGLDDPDAVADAKARAALIKAADNNLQVCVQAILASTASTDAPGAVYSFLYRVLQNSVFFANLDYRQAEGMDLWSDEATVQEFFVRYVSSSYVDEAFARVVEDRVLGNDDTREKEQDDQARSEMGFDDRRTLELRYLEEKYGAPEDAPEDAVVQALSDIQLFFQLTCEAMGWDAARPLPYGNVRNPDGTFTPISDANTALDAAEIKRKAAQQRRREERSKMYSNAQSAAAAILARSAQRKSVHLRK
jgi:hypothetical protein